jgi:hypothetical protein
MADEKWQMANGTRPEIRRTSVMDHVPFAMLTFVS